jgi:hypothetical protein
MDTQPAPDGSDDAASACPGCSRDDGQTIDLSESIEDGCSLPFGERQAREAEARSGHPPADPERAGPCLCRFESPITLEASKIAAPDVERLSQDHPTPAIQYSKSIAGSRRFVIQTERKAS